MRDPEKPIGRIARNGSDIGVFRAAGAIHWYALYEGPQHVFIDDDGRVFALPQGMTHADIWITNRHAWWTGNYHVTGTHGARYRDWVRTDIVADLRVRQAELRGRAA